MSQTTSLGKQRFMFGGSSYMLKAYTNFFQVQRIHVVIENFTMVGKKQHHITGPGFSFLHDMSDMSHSRSLFAFSEDALNIVKLHRFQSPRINIFSPGVPDRSDRYLAVSAPQPEPRTRMVMEFRDGEISSQIYGIWSWGINKFTYQDIYIYIYPIRTRLKIVFYPLVI